MRPSRRHTKVTEQQTQRAERVGAAGPLLTKVPALASLSIIVRESREDGYVGETVYTRRFQLEHTPALIEIPCTYDRCDGGFYDITREVLYALDQRRESFEGRHTCQGQCATGPCPRILRYTATATYRAVSPSDEPSPRLRAVG